MALPEQTPVHGLAFLPLCGIPSWLEGRGDYGGIHNPGTDERVVCEKCCREYAPDDMEECDSCGNVLCAACKSAHWLDCVDEDEDEDWEVNCEGCGEPFDEGDLEECEKCGAMLCFDCEEGHYCTSDIVAESPS